MIHNWMMSLGCSNDDVRQRISDYIAEADAHIKILKEQLGDLETMPVINRDDPIQQLRTDSQSWLMNLRNVIQKYIVRIDIAPDLITIHVVADLADPKPLHVLPSPS